MSSFSGFDRTMDSRIAHSGMPREPACDMEPSLVMPAAHDLGIPPAWLLSQPPLHSKPHAASFGVAQKHENYDVRVEATCEAKPSFTRDRPGAYVMSLPGISVDMTTTCDPYPSLAGLSAAMVMKPRQNFFVRLPVMEQLMFDTALRTPAGLCKVASAHRSLTVLEIPAGHDVKAKINTSAPNGSLTLEDVRYTGSRRDVLSEVVLNYELRSNGKVTLIEQGNSIQVKVSFDFEFNCWLSGFVMSSSSSCTQGLPSTDLSSDTPGRRSHTPGQHLADAAPCAAHDQNGMNARNKRDAYVGSASRLSQSSAMALHALTETEDDLSTIEHRVREISSMLLGARVHDACAVKTELAQLESRAKQLEAAVDNVYTSDLHSGKQPAKDAKKQMLLRFEHLYAGINDAFVSLRPDDCDFKESQASAKSKRDAYVGSKLRLSHSSEMALQALTSTEDELTQIENRTAEIAAALRTACSHSIVGLKAELSQLEAKAKQLETKGIDDVYTSELNSGKQLAKDAKKDMLARFGRLFAEMDETFAAMRIVSA